jgi:hypothetical protein
VGAARLELGQAAVNRAGHLADLLAKLLQDAIGVGVCLATNVGRLSQRSILDIGRA